jgi:signal transduction histidine kinase
LIQNSVHALKESSSPRISIRIQKFQKIYGTGEVQLTVEDNGPGIKKENLDKIFIPFFTTSPSGTGLGLPICQKILELHNGRIEALSEEGAFTKFTVVLPLFSGKR